MGRDNEADGWCILRTRPASTIGLAASLAEQGIEAWTPIAVTSHYRDRLGSRLLPKPERYERTAPIMPTFAFARSIFLPALGALEVDDRSPHPRFSIFRHAGRIPIIGACSVEGLRAEEEAARAKITLVREDEAREVKRQERIALMKTERAKRKALRAETREIASGQRVQVGSAPAFAGMTGVVKHGDGRSYFVSFGGSLKWKIEAWRLTPDDVHAGVTVCA